MAFGKKQGPLPHSQDQVSHLSPFIEGLVLYFSYNLCHAWICAASYYKKKLNIFSSPYVDIAVKAHSFFLLAEWEQCSKHINHRQGISSSYARLCHSVCVENVSHLSCFGILWQFFFFFFSFLNRGFLELLVVLGRQSSQLVILRELGVFSSVCVFVRVR